MSVNVQIVDRYSIDRQFGDGSTFRIAQVGGIEYLLLFDSPGAAITFAERLLAVIRREQPRTIEERLMELERRLG